jgi:transposase
MRFADGKAVVSYVGMIPSEYSSGGQQRLGGLSKQGNPFCDFSGARQPYTPYATIQSLQRFYRRKLAQKGLGKARVAAARKLGIRLWIMLRDQIDYQEFCRRGQMRQKNGGACAGMPEVGHSPAMQ